MNGESQIARDLANRCGESLYGKYRGQVVSNRDPLGLGRLQVVVPAVFEETTVWAEPCVPYAGDDVGFFAMPPVGAAVWVEFEAGDPEFPIWSGCFWADNQSAPEGGTDPGIKVLKTASVTVKVDDNASELLIEVANGASLTLSLTELAAVANVVKNEAMTGKTNLSAAGFDVNDGAFTVI